jgi:hypothetical protein
MKNQTKTIGCAIVLACLVAVILPGLLLATAADAGFISPARQLPPWAVATARLDTVNALTPGLEGEVVDARAGSITAILG